MQQFRALDVYRKIERDFTHSTVAGALLSVVGAVLMVALFVLELRDYLETQVSTQVLMDDFESSLLKINFDITIERLACPFVEVDTENVLGTHKLNLTKNVRKFTVKTKGRFQRRLRENAFESHRISVQAVADPAVVQSSESLNPDVLNPTNFEEYVKNHDLVMIEFYAPWCVWCQRLGPVWKETAHKIKKKYRGRVGIAHCDCTAPDQTRLCHMNHVDRFPTLITYKNRDTHTHSVYHGDRTYDGFAAHVESELQDLGKKDVNEAEREVLEQEELDYLDGDGEHLPAVEGCHLTGFVLVQKVPGSLLFSAVSPHHSFDHSRVNVSHNVHHLNFGQKFEQDELDVLPEQVTDAMHQLSNREFVSVGQNQSHEHYIKVVGTTFKYLDVGTLTTYKYTSMSSTYHSTTKLPIIKFHYDISPMKVVVTETYKPLYQFVTSMFAIIGGVFTVFGLMDGIVYNTQTIIKKKIMLGKQH